MHQADLFDTPARDRGDHLAARDRAMEIVAKRAGEDFYERAAAFVAAYLRQHGPTSSEDLTDACKAAGIEPENDDRAFGPLYARLVKRGVIVWHGYCERRKGHGCAGGNIWRAGA